MEPNELVESISHALSLPNIYFQVSRLIDDPHCTSAKLAKAIAYDPGLTVSILKMANAAFYGRSKQVATIEHAINLIGTRALQHLVLFNSMAQGIRALKIPFINMKAFWQHSVCCALAARSLAIWSQQSQCRERIFVAGLLHDIGQLLISHQLPHIAQKIQRQSIMLDCQQSLYFLEEEELCFTHAEVGAELLKFWMLPESLWEPIQYHHTPLESQRFPVDTALLHISDALVHSMDLETQTFSHAKVMNWVDAETWSRYSQDEQVLQSVVAEVQAQWSEVFEIIGLG